MKESIKNITTLLIISLIIFFLLKIQILIIYIFISLVLSITVTPINNKICNIKIRGFQINKNIAAFMCLLLISLFISLIVFLMSPLIIKEFQIVSSIKIDDIQELLNMISSKVNQKTGRSNVNFDVISILTSLDSSVKIFFESIIDILGNLFFAIFSILFISFFMIRDRTLFKDQIIKYLSSIISESNLKVNTIIYFLRRYVIGISTQISFLFILFGLGMQILNIPHPWTLAIFAAIINIIPYFGPIIGFIFASIIIGTTCLDNNSIDLIFPLIIKAFLLFGIIQSIDNFIIQPTIFSRAFKAHPLEIFFVAISAGFIGGIMWMIIAMPIYSMLRIIFSELITNIK